MTPLSNSFIAPARAAAMEPFYPLHAYACDDCRLVQLEAFETPEKIFSDYVYFSSFSESWLRHAEAYAVRMMERFSLGLQSLVVEVASNDGYLLRHFRDRGVSVLGVEPAANRRRGGQEARHPDRGGLLRPDDGAAPAGRGDGASADGGEQRPGPCARHQRLRRRLRDPAGPGRRDDSGVPHLLRLIESTQFDTIYHEHFSYLSLLTVQRIFAAHGLRVFDVEQLPTHGGSLRIFAAHAEATRHATTPAVAALLARSGRPARRARDLRRLRGARGGREGGAARLLRRGSARRQDDRGLWRAGQGQHAAELLRHRARVHPVHRGTAARTSRASCCPVCGSPSARPRRSWSSAPTTS